MVPKSKWIDEIKEYLTIRRHYNVALDRKRKLIRTQPAPAEFG